MAMHVGLAFALAALALCCRLSVALQLGRGHAIRRGCGCTHGIKAPSRVRPLFISPGVDSDVVEILKAFAPLATILIFQSVNDKRFADNQSAADKRFADLVKSLGETRSADKETLNAIVDKLAAEIGFVSQRSHTAEEKNDVK
jgi:hypothetical protein